jgi:tetratricopeptide (TPR) repeat protein
MNMSSSWPSLARVPVLAMVSAAALFSGVALTAQESSHSWRSNAHGIEITALPDGWKMEKSTEQSFNLTKRFATDGLEFQERINLQIARDSYGGVENAVRQLRGEGYYLVDQARLSIDSLGAPFWIMSRQTGPEESGFLALVMRGGKVYMLELRSTPLDDAALDDFEQVIKNVRLLLEPRQEAWKALSAGNAAEARQQFEQVLDSDHDDANARYGLGLAKLAQGDAAGAIPELERAGQALGLEEDVRRALGRAEFARGRLSRAAGLWVEVLRDDPGWDKELRPSILLAIRGLGQRGSGIAASKIAALTALALEFLSRIRSGDELMLAGLQDAFRDGYRQVVDICLAGGCNGQQASFLLAAVDLEQAMSLAVAGVHNKDESKIVGAQMKLADGFNAITLGAR